MTRKQLRDVTALYATQFSEWSLEGNGTVFGRCDGPVRQIIWFEKLRSGSYRPSHGITAIPLAKANIFMLPQLPFRPSTVEYRWHDRKWPEMLAAMERDFRPNIREPLDVSEVLALCEAESRPDSMNDLAMLAILHAWLGRDGEALQCCQRMLRLELSSVAAIREREDTLVTFGSRLEDAVTSGIAREFLTTA